MVNFTLSVWSGFSSGDNHTQGEFPMALGAIAVGPWANKFVGFIGANPKINAVRQRITPILSLDLDMDFLLFSLAALWCCGKTYFVTGCFSTPGVV
jgi:hypothetical protein